MSDNFTNLTRYIKNSYIKDMFTSSYICVDSMEDAEKWGRNFSLGEYNNLIFKTSYMKEVFFTTITSNRKDITIINCNSNTSKLNELLWNAKGLIIYNNIDRCEDPDVIDIIRNKKGYFIC